MTAPPAEEGGARRLTLTFDNGPVPGNTERILAALADHEMPGIFFMVGERVLAPGGRRTAERVHAAGHRIGNHTLSHGPPLGELDDAASVAAEISGGQSPLEGLTDPARLFRPNGRGRLGPHLVNQAAIDQFTSEGYTVVTWNCVPRDWEEPCDGWVARANADLDRLDWTVLVLHDHHPRALDHLPGFLDGVRARGIEVTDELPESCILIDRGRPRPALKHLLDPGGEPRMPS